MFKKLVTLLFFLLSGTASALNIGDQAPDFSLPDQNGQTKTLKENLGKWVILYFYPMDDTPGCTTEACSFRDATDKILSKKRLFMVLVLMMLNRIKSLPKNIHFPSPFLLMLREMLPNLITL